MSSTAVTSAPIELPHSAYILPTDIAMWPPAWWFWPIIFSLTIIILISAIWQYKHFRQNAYRREAISLMKEIDDLEDQALLSHCHTLIRRCLICTGGLKEASKITSELVSTLDETMPKKHRFSELGGWFIDGLYQPRLTLTSEQREQLIKRTNIWLRKHRD